MYSKIFILIVFALLGALSAVADEPSRNGRHNPFNQLQDQIEALDARIEALEESAPNSGIDGRSYCSMLNVQIMRAFPGSQTETTQNVIVRRVVSFDGGVLNGPLLSRTLNDHSDIGTLSNTSNNPVIDPLVASYVQTGSKVDITFADGSTAN